MTKTEALRMALEALKQSDYIMMDGDDVDVVDEIEKVMAQPEQEPVAWVYPEGLEAFKSGKPWTAYGENGDGPYPDGVKRIPLYLNDAVARRVEPRASGSGAGFESLPASPNQPGENT